MKRNDKEIKKQIALKLSSALILFFSFSLVVIGQSKDSDESVPVIISDQAKEQVVRRILTLYFKPRNQKKIIYLAEKDIQASWLPPIKGIEFQVLSTSEAEEKDAVYFFTKLEQNSQNRYEIGFAYGDPSCDFTGDIWYFRIVRNKIKLWHDGSGFGNGCGRSSSNGYGFLIMPQSNNSMDVRAKQRLCYQTCVVTFGGRGGGFAPRHLNRYVASIYSNESNNECKNQYEVNF